ncbi:unnamed protein product [Hyaloperonospora brassicae]|uniref:RxLR effector candidate protein n=1 Tax=Hyaloperonospora brassicae TaxID=162125 RepID=A0AAV0UJV6_HYABA|nr:unnamed protein product [Hyaloperonospora brassicae]
MHCSGVVMLLLYALVLLTAVLVKADAVTEALASNRTTSEAESSAVTRDKVDTRRFARPDETEERAATGFPSTMSTAKSWLESFGSVFKNGARDLTSSLTSTSKITLYAKSLGSRIINSIRAHYWLRNKESAVGVFKRLKLDTGLEENLLSPKLKTWVTFVDVYNKRNPNKKVSIARILSDTYTDVKLAQALRGPIVPRDKRPLLARLEKELMNNWEQDIQTTRDVFRLLKLHVPGSNIFERPELSLWYMYTLKVQKDPNRSMAKTLLKHYKWDAVETMHKNYNKPGDFRLQDNWVNLGRALALYRRSRQAVKVSRQATSNRKPLDDEK